MVNRPTLTVLTDPIRFGRHFAPEMVKHLLRRIRNFFRPRPPHLRGPYRGHFAVTRSLVEGLKSLGVHATYNPSAISDVAETVVVLCSVSALRQAIQFKRAGKIRHILAGPNILVFPSDHSGLIASPEVDVCLVNSEWTRQMYLDDCPALQGRCIPWPAGVDINLWKPGDASVERQTVLIYEKQLDNRAGSIDSYRDTLLKRGYKVEIIKYGHYSPVEYLLKLQQAVLMVGFTQSESQGLAWAEAWAVNVPTLIWRNEECTYQDRTFACSTAPHLNSQTGMFFDGAADFGEMLSYWEQHRQQFKPREWVLGHMSDQVCAQNLLDIAEGLNKKPQDCKSVDV